MKFSSIAAGPGRPNSIYDNRGLTEMEARRMEESPRYGNLRIIEEKYDEKTKLRTIYSRKKLPKKPRPRAPRTTTS